jgi:hypothetical protein
MPRSDQSSGRHNVSIPLRRAQIAQIKNVDAFFAPWLWIEARSRRQAVGDIDDTLPRDEITKYIS